MKRQVTATVFTLAYVCCLLLVYWLHVRYMRVDVVFYAAIVDSVIAAGILLAPLILSQHSHCLTALEKQLLVVVWLLGGYSFAISVPTVIDRSLSFYILEKLEQRGGGILLDRFSDVFTFEYLPEHRLVDVRITEQEQSGTIYIDRGCVRLTEKGRRIAHMSLYFRSHFLPQKRLLRGEYTNVLTHPFKNGVITVDYKC